MLLEVNSLENASSTCEIIVSVVISILIVKNPISIIGDGRLQAHGCWSCVGDVFATRAKNAKFAQISR